MPQLDFREALSTSEERLLSPAATATALTATSLDRERSVFARGVRLSRSTLTNIFFVAIASVGGLVCGFYFFNGGDLLRAAAAWPNEFLYPRPLSTELSTDKIDIGEQPNPVDRFARNESGSTATEEAKGPFGENVGPSDFSQPATTISASNPTVTTPSGPDATLLPTAPSLPATPSVPTAPSLPSGLGLPSAPSTDSLFQSLYQTATSMTPKKAITRTASSTRNSARRKASSAQQKAAGQTKNTTSSARSTAQNQNMQQSFNQTQAPMNSIQASSAMGMSGGLGGGLGGAVGGVGGGLGGGLGGLGGTVSGIIGGHH